MKKKEKIFLLIVILAAFFSWTAVKLFVKDSHDIIKITVNGEFFGTYSLSEEQVIPIGSTNICEIKNGTAKMISATCPDHLCIKQNPIDIHGGTIVCLPNKVVIEGGISASSADVFSAVDAVS